MAMIAVDPEGARPAPTRARVAVTLMLHAFVIWGLCGVTVAIGTNVTSQANALLAHAIAAPLIAATVSSFYFSRFRYTAPLPTASLILAFIALLDFFLVALVINRSLAMFRSFAGTWLPFTLIFGAVYLTGVAMTRSRR
ncbi:MAG TPA: hypothetical protein VMK12_20850 [Anaeromyxobacteraceae bacterium]|nr:hypothetical protein [Anaeromyxobacteraceae bacterium]